jgi:hypothetical protein
MVLGRIDCPAGYIGLSAVGFEFQAGLRELGSQAFWHCMSLRSISLPASVVTIGPSCFRWCEGLIGAWLGGGSLSEVGHYAFSHCHQLFSLGLSAEGQISVIRPSLCGYCEALRSVFIPGSVTVIESCAFSNCQLLSEVDFGKPSNLSRIESCAFWSCFSLHSFYIVGSVSHIDVDFIRDSGVREIIVDEDHCHFRSVDPFLLEQEEEGPSAIVYFGCEAEVVIPACVVVLKARLFDRRDSLEAVTFEERSQLKSIEREAFSTCRRLRSIGLPGFVEVIGAEAFAWCQSLAEVTFERPLRLRVIDERAFQGCCSLTSMRFPSSLKSIGQDSFCFCENLRSVTFDSDSARPEIHPRAFSECLNLDRVFLSERAD